MARKYFTLLVRDSLTSPWRIEFGDFSRDVVREEALDLGERMARRNEAPRFRANQLKIISSEPDQPSIDAAVRAINLDYQPAR